MDTHRRTPKIMITMPPENKTVRPHFLAGGSFAAQNMGTGIMKRYRSLKMLRARQVYMTTRLIAGIHKSDECDR
jgi:hypothetical protein